MSKLQNKNLSELFEIGYHLEIDEKITFVSSVRQFSSEKADELERMFAVDPAQMGFDLATTTLNKAPHTFNELEVPKTIGKYVIKKVIGIGGMGIVYLGKREDINQLVAVKVANTILPQGSKTDAITHEAKILASLQHPNIASLVDWGNYQSNRHFVATEYVNGSSLVDYCDKNKLDVISRIKLFFKVLDAVEYAHSNLVIHRDLKPNNILVEKSGTVKLIDFGVSRLMKTSNDTHHQTIGAALTPSYASPEQLSGKPLSIRSDIYSLGAVLLYLLTGKQIKYTNNNQQQAQISIRENLSDSFNSNKRSLLWQRVGQQTLSDIILVINKAMSIDVNIRYQNSQSFQEDLQAIVKIRPIKARKPSKLYWLKKYVARNRITTSVIVMAFLLTLLATTFASWHWYKTIQQKDEIIAAHLQLKTYANFLNTTLKGMDTYSGGNPNITMQEFMKRAIELYQKEQNVSSERLAFHAVTLSSIYESWGQYNDALRVLETGYEHAKISSTPHDDVSLLTEKSLLHGNDLQYQLGTQAALEALEIIKKHPETEWRSPYTMLALSSSYRDSGQLAKSLQVTDKIINDSKRTAKEVAFAAYAQAKIQARLFHLDKAIDNINIALKTYKEEYGKNSAQVADSEALLFILEIRKTRNNFTIAERNKLMTKFKNVYNENHPNMAWLLATIAEAYYLTADIKQAIAMQQKAVSLYESLSDTVITDITLARMHLARYLIINNEVDSAGAALKVIKNIDFGLLPNHVLAEYYILRAWHYILTNQYSLAANSLQSAREYLKNSEYLGIVAEYDFQVAQLAALEKKWLKCSQYSLKAIQIATNFYPASWDLHAVYQALQNKCLSKLPQTSKILIQNITK